jgi:hypothetical protein
MKAFYKKRYLAVAFHLLAILLLSQIAISADNDNTVIPAVESAINQGVSTEIIARVLSYSIDYRLNTEQASYIISILTEANKANLPLNPIHNKIREGLNKQIPPKLLIIGLRRHLDDYIFVDKLLYKKYNDSKAYNDEAIIGLVDSINYGITKDEMKQLFKTAPMVPPEMLSIAAKNKALLRQIGYDDKLIDDILITGLENSSLTSRWELLFKVAAAADKKEISKTAFVNASKKVLIQNGDIVQVLELLDFTLRDVKHGPHLDSLSEEND